MPKSNLTTNQLTAKGTARKTRKSGYQRLIDEEEDLIVKQLASRKQSSEQMRAALTSLLIELLNVTGVGVSDEQIVRIFFQRAARVAEQTYTPRDRFAMFDVLTDISRLLGTTSHEVFSMETLDFVSRHSRFPHPGEPLDMNGEEVEPTPREENESLITLRQRLNRLERLPENEATAFQLETEIYRLKNESPADEWPDLIAA